MRFVFRNLIRAEVFYMIKNPKLEKSQTNKTDLLVSQRFIDPASHINIDDYDDLLLVIYFGKSTILPNPHPVDAIFNPYEIPGIRKLFEGTEMSADAFVV